MNTRVITNYSKLKTPLFILPLCILLSIVLCLYFLHSLNALNYIQIQKKYFFFLNSKLSQFPNIEYNLTQFGDALIFLSLLSILIVYTPKLWESLITASLVSAIFSFSLKVLFAVPRPAVVFDKNSFVVVGKTLHANNSLPSGHAITIFTTLTVLLFAFMPHRLIYRTLWIGVVVVTGLILGFTRVGVGAHYPLDVITGSVVGYISGITGIFINEKYKIWSWINYKKYYPILMVLFMVCLIVIISKINHENLIIYYFCMASLLASLYKIVSIYAKK